MPGTRFSVEVRPRIPERLERLKELAGDLFYSWDREVRGLFWRIDPDLWETCHHNPTLFLRRVAQDKLEDAARDRVFREAYNRVLSAYDTYQQEGMAPAVDGSLSPDDLIAYFCFEFGLHESFPIYSGGLGILAGDHCKAASDLGLPFVAVGLLYRQGYFIQTIDTHGNQIAHYTPASYHDLPLTYAQDKDGNKLRVHVDIQGRKVAMRVWIAKAGRIRLVLLDTDVPENSEADRAITYQLYGGDRHVRIQQEIVLGIGGVRALRALGLNPTVWHINEGHAAFSILERARECVAEGLDFEGALEFAASNTVFTTHTPVPAGHDVFDHGHMLAYFGDYLKALKIPRERFLQLGASPIDPHGFNQTALAIRGSRFRNGVSRIHGGVAARMESYAWPQIPPDENPMGYITNGVHVPTFLAREWANLFDMRIGGGWRSELLNERFWERIDEIPDHSFWSVRQLLKTELLQDVCRRAERQHRANGASDAEIERILARVRNTEADMLVIGFARRFATYKRAAIFFSDAARLARLLNDPDRPAVLLFAGKAHPHDKPGQNLIKTIYEFSRRPEFEGRVLLLEGYDHALARKMVTGCDIWVNMPEYPLEASGTSGEKAGINGVLNLSVLDGWWGEGFDGENGWAINPHGPQFDRDYRDREEGKELLDILEHRAIPLFFKRDGRDFPTGWVAKAKRSMKTLIPRFNSQRMVMDYVTRFYGAARRQRMVFAANGYARAREVANWRTRIAERWPGVRLRRLDAVPEHIAAGESLPIRVAVALNGLSPDDVLMECIVRPDGHETEAQSAAVYLFAGGETLETGEIVFALDMVPRLPGLQHYQVRLFPFHPALSHRYESGYMMWL